MATPPTAVGNCSVAAAPDFAPLSPATTSKRARTAPPAPDTLSGAEIARGAEAVVTRVPLYLGARGAVVKRRLPKRYRHPELDARLTARRVAQEARALHRARRAGVHVPAVYSVDTERSTLVLEDVCAGAGGGGVAARTMREFLRAGGGEGVAEAAMREAGRAVRRMHGADIVHGDLTTSNMIVRPCKDGPSDVAQTKESTRVEVVLIDFGLSSGNGTEEDKAVDLYVLERAIVAAHPERAEVLNAEMIKAYEYCCDPGLAMPVLTRLVEVRSRGRKRDMAG